MQEMQETRVRSLVWGDTLEWEMLTHSSILAWTIPWSLADYIPWGRKELDTTEPLTHTYTHSHTHMLLGSGTCRNQEESIPQYQLPLL